MAVREIVVAGGCFWGTQAFMARIPGVLATECGYANALIDAPTYEMVCTGVTGAAEAVRVRFDDSVLSLPLLLEAFLSSIDPTSVNRQGHDVGTQYRTGIYWSNPRDEALVHAILQGAQAASIRPIAVEAKALTAFVRAEDAHQDYLQKHPGGYCHVDLRKADEFVTRRAGDFKNLAPAAI